MISQFIDPIQVQATTPSLKKRQSLGIQSIMDRYQRKSFSARFPNWFTAYIQKQNYVLEDRALFCGNVSDLWGLLYNQIKFIPQIFQDQADLDVIEKQIQTGQILMLSLAQKNIQNIKLKLLVLQLYLLKVKSFKDQILKQVKIKINSARFSEKSRSTNFDSNRMLYGKDQKIQNFIFINSSEHCLMQYLSSLSFRLKMIINSINKYMKNTQNNKKCLLKVKILSIYLLFLLKNRQWDKICMSKLTVTNHVIKFLIQVNGAMKVSKYLDDASPDLLLKETNKFCEQLL